MELSLTHLCNSSNKFTSVSACSTSKITSPSPSIAFRLPQETEVWPMWNRSFTVSSFVSNGAVWPHRGVSSLGTASIWRTHRRGPWGIEYYKLVYYALKCMVIRKPLKNYVLLIMCGLRCQTHLYVSYIFSAIITTSQKR